MQSFTFPETNGPNGQVSANVNGYKKNGYKHMSNGQRNSPQNGHRISPANGQRIVTSLEGVASFNTVFASSLLFIIFKSLMSLPLYKKINVNKIMKDKKRKKIVNISYKWTENFTAHKWTKNFSS
jgi:hypothetical protein